MTHGWAQVILDLPDAQGLRAAPSDQGAHPAPTEARPDVSYVDGLAEIDASIAGMRLTLGGISVVFLSSRIEALMHLRQFAAALTQIGQALTEAQQTGDGHFLAELHRLQGVCLLEIHPDDADARAQAQACFEQALAISSQQHAKALALRAATSLQQLHLQHGLAATGTACVQVATDGSDESPALPDQAQALVSLRTLQA